VIILALPSAKYLASVPMEISYDATCDMAYITLTGSKGNYDYSVPLENRKDTAAFVLDLDKEGRLIGIEVFNASRRLPKELIEQALRIEQMKKEPRELSPGC
jgi:uncharacterized protein YuzE